LNQFRLVIVSSDFCGAYCSPPGPGHGASRATLGAGRICAGRSARRWLAALQAEAGTLDEDAGGGAGWETSGYTWAIRLNGGDAGRGVVVRFERRLGPILITERRRATAGMEFSLRKRERLRKLDNSHQGSELSGRWPSGRGPGRRPCPIDGLDAARKWCVRAIVGWRPTGK